MKRFLVIALLFLADCCLSQKSPSQVIPIGGRGADFEALVGDTVSATGEQGGTEIHWTVNGGKGSLRGLNRPLEPGQLKGMKSLSLSGRSDRPLTMWIQLSEQSGETHYVAFKLGKSWQEGQIPFRSFQLNQRKGGNGTLDLDQVFRLSFLDVSGLQGVSGRREIWLKNIAFRSDEVVPMAEKRSRPSYFRPLTTGKAGLTCVPKDFRETEQSWVGLFERAHDAGIEILSLQTGFWDRIERTPGAYDFKQWEQFFAIADRHGFEFSFAKDFPGPFFHEKLTIPKDITFRSFDDPFLLQRYGQLLTAYLDRFSGRHPYAVIHSEGAETYFKRFPDQVEAYCRFLSHARKVIHDHSPGIKVGVNTYANVPDEILARMGAATDFTAYELMKGKALKSPGELESVVTRLLRLAGAKKIAFQNVGWSTSKVDGSSEEEQKEFIKEFYRVVSKYRSRFEYASFGAMYDHDLAITMPAYQAQFPEIPQPALTRIVDSMSRFGLIRTDGSEKPAYTEFLKQVKDYYQTATER